MYCRVFDSGRFTFESRGGSRDVDDDRVISESDLSSFFFRRRVQVDVDGRVVDTSSSSLSVRRSIDVNVVVGSGFR